MEKEKKIYKKPLLETYRLAYSQQILAGSGGQGGGGDIEDDARPYDGDF